MKGKKHTRLARFDLIPVRELWDLAQVFGYGAVKYGEYNWKNGYEWSSCYAALQRHLTRFWGGESHDKESGLHHLAHAMFHCMALMYWDRYNYTIYKEYDDRPEPFEKLETQTIQFKSKVLEKHFEYPKNEDDTCSLCSGTGCPCFRSRDWQTIELGCSCGCPNCGLNYSWEVHVDE